MTPTRLSPQPATNAELFARYGYLPTMVTLHTRCGCTRTIQIDVESPDRVKGLPPLIGITLDPVSPLSPFWMPDEARLRTQETERIFFHASIDKYGDPYHYEESGDERPRQTATSKERATGTRLITLDDEPVQP